jgi:hypothetical protein
MAGENLIFFPFADVALRIWEVIEIELSVEPIEPPEFTIFWVLTCDHLGVPFFSFFNRK